MVGREGRRRPGGTRALVVDAVAARLRQLAEEAHRLGREAAPHLGDEYALCFADAPIVQESIARDAQTGTSRCT